MENGNNGNLHVDNPRSRGASPQLIRAPQLRAYTPYPTRCWESDSIKRNHNHAETQERKHHRKTTGGAVHQRSRGAVSCFHFQIIAVV
ncbi:hypothetical protein CEXT_353781 [Caerostris extrusa]|uniref:Uncharacterized protein n=1 Tax=Caerostris extrusa TaxID=172846 RepID=A0AAV4MBS4_CAEEX|nr:hypothetical protein CEXT_353781 [Caerostris extrusa]